MKLKKVVVMRGGVWYEVKEGGGHEGWGVV